MPSAAWIKELFTKWPGTQACRLQRASLTIEAAAAFPVFLVAVILLLWPLKVMDAERKLMIRAEEITSAKSMAAHFVNSGEDASTEDLLTGAALAVEADRGIFRDVIPVISVDPGENGMISTGISYAIRWPSGMFDGLVTVRHSSVSVRRAWIGRKGGAGRNYGDPGAGEEATEDVVYLGRNSLTSKVYHEKRTCSYLDNKLREVTADQAAVMKNAYGEKYHPCPSCRPAAKGTVYIFENGNAWHSSPDCKAIGAYVTVIPKKEALERGYQPCHRCSAEP